MSSYYILNKLGNNLVLTVNKDDHLVSRPAQKPISNNQLWTVDRVKTDEHSQDYLYSKVAGSILQFTNKDSDHPCVTDPNKGGGSGLQFVRKDPDNYVDIQETAPPQHVLGISEDNPAPDTPVLSLKATNANGQKWLLVPHK